MSGNKKQYLVLGSTGLVGSAFAHLYQKSIITAGRNHCDYKLDLTSKDQIEKIVGNAPVNVVINFAAYTNVDEAEKQKGDLKSQTYILNAKVPVWLAKACAKDHKHFIHISTDYVFDGRQDDRPYTETDPAEPVDSWYCQTKRLGEKRVEKAFRNKRGWAIIRISFPYSDYYQRKLDIARTVIEQLKKGLIYYAVTDEKIKPTHVREIAEDVNLIAEKRAYGIYHVAGDWPGGFITPYDFAQKIAGDHHLDISLIKPIAFKNFLKTRIAPRPQHTWLDTKKIKSLKNLFLPNPK
jgi:dTDP-4-dehydrorhamnose reductase